MRNSEELVTSLHLRMLQKRQKREKRVTSVIGAAWAGLMLCLVALVFGGSLHPFGTADVYSGASILFENAGPYVLVAIAAFMAGVVITVLIKRQQAGNGQSGSKKTEPEDRKRIDLIQDDALLAAVGGKKENQGEEEKKMDRTGGMP